MNPIAQALQPLLAFVFTTPLQFTTANDAVFALWQSLVVASDIFLALLLVIGAIQMMYGQVTGSVYLPPGQFLGRAVLTVILMHISWLFGQDLIIFNNTVCLFFRVDTRAFLALLNHGQFGQVSLTNLSTVLTIFTGLVIVRVVFQAIKRIVFIDLLFIFSGPALLMTFHPATSAWFSFWARTFVTTILTQVLQVAAFALGLQFVAATQQHGLTQGLLGIAMLYLMGEIPSLLSRFAASAGASASGMGTLVRSIVMLSALGG